MRTEIVILASSIGGDRYTKRATFDLKQAGPEKARFIPAHTEKFSRGFSAQEETRERPDMLHVASGLYQFKGGKCDRVRRIPEEYVARLGELDERIAALHAERRELTDEAFRRGVPVKRSEFTTPAAVAAPAKV